MVIRKVKTLGPDGRSMIDAQEVPVTESNEKWSEFVLEDGTVIRAKINIISFMRIEGQFDAEGNPLYGMKGIPTHVIVSVPDELKKKVQ